MKRILSSLLLLSLPFAANATLIDFDTSPAGAIASGTIITNQYSSLGVSFSASENGSPVDAWAVTQFAATAAGAGHSGNSLWNCNVGCGPRADILRMDFAAPVSNVSWYTILKAACPSPSMPTTSMMCCWRVSPSRRTFPSSY